MKDSNQAYVIDRDRLKAAIKKSGKTQKEIAEELNITYTGFNHAIKNGKISKYYIYDLCELLGISVYWVRGLSDVNDVRNDLILHFDKIKKDSTQYIAHHFYEIYREEFKYFEVYDYPVFDDELDQLDFDSRFVGQAFEGMINVLKEVNQK